MHVPSAKQCFGLDSNDSSYNDRHKVSWLALASNCISVIKVSMRSTPESTLGFREREIETSARVRQGDACDDHIFAVNYAAPWGSEL